MARDYREHYGPSKLTNKSAMQCTIAIPYTANEKPNERSRFGNPLETVNYTIQSLLYSGLNDQLLAELIQQWLIEVRVEFQKRAGYYSLLEETPTAIGINHYLAETGLTLHTINRHNSEHLSLVSRHLCHQKSFLFYVLKKWVLPQITNEPAILHSDAYNHVDIYRTAQGLSGTPWNQSTYHNRLQFNYKTSLGTDGLIQEVLKVQQTVIRPISYTHFTHYWQQLYQSTENPELMRALIDISATLTGISPLEVAQELADFYRESATSIKYILYFNENDVLYALDINTQKAVELASSDVQEINQRLNCTPDQRFTYYDQAHTIGTDISQMSEARAFCLVDQKTHLQSFLQGCMRMRGLQKKQRIDIVVPASIEALSLTELFHHMETTEQAQLQQDNFVAALAKMENIIRNHLLQRIAQLDEHDVEKQHQWALVFKHYFMREQDTRIFEQYGGIYHQEKTAILLHQYLEYLLRDLQKCLLRIEIEADEKQFMEVTQALQTIIDQSLPTCPDTALSRVSRQDIEVETQKEKEVAIETEKLQETEYFDSSLFEHEYQKWTLDDVHAFSVGTMEIMSLNYYCRLKDSIFLPELIATRNYAYSYEGQTVLLNGFIKPVNVILWRHFDDKISACLISNQEAMEITVILRESPIPGIWLSSTSHTPLVGQPPSSLLNNYEYLRLMEQIRFFAGQLDLLIQQDTPYVWLNDNTTEKLSFFCARIMPYRETSAQSFHHLEIALDQKNQGLTYIAERALHDLRSIDWKILFPDASKSNIASYKILAAVFYDLNQHYFDDGFDFNLFQKKYMMFPAAIAYLLKHARSLNAFKRFIEDIQQIKPTDLSVVHFSQQDHALLQMTLHIDMNILMILLQKSMTKTNKKSRWLTNEVPDMAVLLQAIYDNLQISNNLKNALINYILIIRKPMVSEIVMTGESSYFEIFRGAEHEEGAISNLLENIKSKADLLERLFNHLLSKPTLSQPVYQLILRYYHQISDANIRKIIHHARSDESSSHFCSLLEVSGLVFGDELNDLFLRVLQQSYSEKITWVNLQRLTEKIRTRNRVQGFHLNTDNTSQWLHERLELVSENSAVNKFLTSLDQLRLKAIEFHEKATKKPSYKKAAESAFLLYLLLKKTTADYLQTGDRDAFQAQFKQAIATYSSVLEEHRGIKQLLYDMINIFLVVITLGGITLGTGKDYRLFKAKTNAQKIIEDLNPDDVNPTNQM